MLVFVKLVSKIITMFSEIEIILLSQEYSVLQEPASFLIFILREIRKIKTEGILNLSCSPAHLKVLFTLSCVEKILEQVLGDIVDPNMLKKCKLQGKSYLSESKSNTVDGIPICLKTRSSVSRF